MVCILSCQGWVTSTIFPNSLSVPTISVQQVLAAALPQTHPRGCEAVSIKQAQRQGASAWMIQTCRCWLVVKDSQHMQRKCEHWLLTKIYLFNMVSLQVNELWIISLCMQTIPKTIDFEFDDSKKSSGKDEERKPHVLNMRSGKLQTVLPCFSGALPAPESWNGGRCVSINQCYTSLFFCLSAAFVASLGYVILAVDYCQVLVQEDLVVEVVNRKGSYKLRKMLGPGVRRLGPSCI